MASALLAMLTQQTPDLETRKGLIIIGVQNEFLAPDGKLPVSLPAGFWKNLRDFVPAFREFGEVIWVRSTSKQSQATDDVDIGDSILIEPKAGSSFDEDQGERDEEDDDDRDSPVPLKRPRVSSREADSTPTIDAIGAPTSDPDSEDGALQGDAAKEAFLSETGSGERYCVPKTRGAELCPEAKSLIDQDKDIQTTTSHYSAFEGGSLLFTLRSKLITELFICGCPTNSSVYATAKDAARFGLQINLVEDLLAARTHVRHDLAMQRMHDLLEADIMTSDEAIDFLKNPPEILEDDEEFEEYDGESEYEDFEYPSEDYRRKADIDTLRSSPAHDPAIKPSRDRPPSSDLHDGLRDLKFSPRAAPMPLDSTLTASARPKGDYSQDAPQHPRIEQEGNDQSSLVTNTSGKDESLNSILFKRFMKQQEAAEAPSASSTRRDLNAIASLCCFNQKSVSEYEGKMSQARGVRSQPLFGADKELESAGSTITFDLLPPSSAGTVFERLEQEINWQRMYHQTGEVPRLVCCQGTIDEDGGKPIYRHPSDQSLPTEAWTATVDEIRKAAEEHVGHPLNHALIQEYRSGVDYISEHSDKTLDVTPGTCIVNVSFGAQRTMRIRSKRASKDNSEIASPARTTYRVPMPHNSMIKMTLATNGEYLHGINADKRPAVELSEEEKAYDGKRISLTFRNIGTFLSRDSTLIWGQGATSKSKKTASQVINGDAEESERLIMAFGAENQATSIDWSSIYSAGSDVLHLK